MSVESLRAALAPRSVAIIGASENPNKIGGRPVAYLARFGFRGKVYPINPRREEVQGFHSFPDLASLPEVPETVVVAVAGDGAVAAVEECAQRGVKMAVVMTSGFGETGLPEALAKERHMVATARAHGMRMIGPNAQGLANFGTGAILSFSTMFIEQEPGDGPVAMCSQSGAMSVVPYGLLRRRGIGVRHAHATGNDADVTVAELACAVASDPDVKLLLLYLESIPDPHNLAEAARIARERELPIVALKSGRTAAGQQAALSHTGALATEDRVVDAFLARHGIWRVKDIAGLVRAAELYLKGWRPRGRRLAVVSNSGATCVMAADAATLAGLTMAPLAAATRAALDRVLPSFATTTNPVDITAALLSNSRLFGDILPILAGDAAVDALMVGLPVAGVGYDVDAFAQDTASFAQATGKPVVVAAPQPNVGQRFKEEGLAVFELEVEAIEALAQLIGHLELIAHVRGTAPSTAALATAAARRGRVLNEAESLAFVAARGIRVVPHRLCRSEVEVRAAFAALGPKVAVKGCSAEVTHKSELGLVRLGLADADAVAAAYHDIGAHSRRDVAGALTVSSSPPGGGAARAHDRRSSRSRLRPGRGRGGGREVRRGASRPQGPLAALHGGGGHGGHSSPPYRTAFPRPARRARDGHGSPRGSRGRRRPHDDRPHLPHPEPRPQSRAPRQPRRRLHGRRCGRDPGGVIRAAARLKIYAMRHEHRIVCTAMTHEGDPP